MWNPGSVRLEMGLVLVQYRCTVCVERTIGLEKSFWMHPMELLGDVGLWKLTSFCLVTVLVSVQDSFMVCARHTISSKIILDAPDGTSR